MPPHAKPHAPTKATQNAAENSRCHKGLITSQKAASATSIEAARIDTRFACPNLVKVRHKSQPAATANGYPTIVIIPAEMGATKSSRKSPTTSDRTTMNINATGKIASGAVASALPWLM